MNDSNQNKFYYRYRNPYLDKWLSFNLTLNDLKSGLFWFHENGQFTNIKTIRDLVNLFALDIISIAFEFEIPGYLSLQIEKLLKKQKNELALTPKQKALCTDYYRKVIINNKNLEILNLREGLIDNFILELLERRENNKKNPTANLVLTSEHTFPNTFVKNVYKVYNLDLDVIQTKEGRFFINKSINQRS